MRIALVSDCYLPRLGGIELHVHDLAAQLRLAGNSVAVFTVTDSTGPDQGPVLRLPAVGGIPLPEAINALRRSLGSGMYDVVHAHTSFFSPLAWSAARIAAAAGVPTILTLHSLPAAGGVLAPRLLAGLDARLGPRIVWTAVSEVVADSLRQALPGRSVEILHNGIDPAPWRQPRHAGGPPTLVSTMRLVRRKRPFALLRILEAVRSESPANLRAVIVGDGPNAPALARAVERRGMTDWVELPGRLRRAEIQRLYAKTDVFLAPARLESFGVAALEARCAGLAVVAMGSGGVGEFIRPGVEGFLVDSDEQMAQVTAALLTDPVRLHRMQNHNRRTASGMAWPNVIGRHLHVYGRVAPQPALSAPVLASNSTAYENLQPTEPTR
ncbi:glycosyltransferase involved in cell wall biosynthesis [Kribbella voronezhensis]|uniref:Glycosyltransferase involved in cell wall biosynthesis n=1 Tax=Kribbella voronezhensis TaxID=2512212 RepID=A0A4R7SW78_9ACTN|nr:glycosyltransferase family 4 protein [Kribbella voronezhensis]TDU83592.1 glycosyltransferase involved in cell wall biosynthesis [Kribbella voronezhensis]